MLRKIAGNNLFNNCGIIYLGFKLTCTHTFECLKKVIKIQTKT